MKKFNYKKYIKNGKKFFLDNKKKDIEYVKNDSKILISVPHGVSQIRLGKFKYPEKSTVPFALELSKRTSSNLIVKTSSKYDDANFDEKSFYKTRIMNELENIKYIIDIHGLSSKRGMDINLGTNIGFNISRNPVIFDNLLKLLEENNFTYTIDEPFKGGGSTIAGTFSKYVWTLQIEINASITSLKENKEKLSNLLTVLENWINGIKDNTIKDINN